MKKEITINLYTYNDLPTEAAKEKARQWWIDLEIKYPAWMNEHDASMMAALSAWSNVDKEDARQVAYFANMSRDCGWTGYCADTIPANMIEDGSVLSEDSIMNEYARQWDADLADRLSNIHAIGETLEANEYWFNANGEFQS